MLYLALSAVLVALVAGLAFTARQPPPPQIAELTPQAQHQITRAPSQLAGSVGATSAGACSGIGPCRQGAGPGPGSVPTTTTTPSVPTSLPIDVAAVHHCFGNPPRQIQDTQSPPCVPYWAGKNGGATSMGVTATQVKVIVFPMNGLDPSHEQRVFNDLEQFFNRYFEFYGRTLQFIPPSSGVGGSCSTINSQADGIAQAYQPFASESDVYGAGLCYPIEMARDHVVVTAYGADVTQPLLASYAPYLYSYMMSGDAELENIGSFICSQLAHKDAAYSPDPSIASHERKFGLVIQYDPTPYPPSGQPLRNALAKCGTSLAVTEKWENTTTGAPQQSSQSAAQFDQSAILKMKQEGVTTVMCLCDDSDPSTGEPQLPAAADEQAYYPEWLLYGDNSYDSVVNTYWPNADQRRAMFGVTFEPAQVPYPDGTLNWALASVDPGFQVDYNSLDYYIYQRTYWDLLLLASGIQMAGPDLTANTFERGLKLARFPNPYSPQMEGVATFAGGSLSMTADAAVMWWSNTAQGPYPDGGTGAWCYVDGGRRFGDPANDWSTPMSFFAGACDSSPPGS